LAIHEARNKNPKESEMVKKKAATTNRALQPVDIHGNWSVEALNFEEPEVPFGLREGRSEFTIDKEGSKHVLIKKKTVGWNGSKTTIPLTEIKNSKKEEALFNANLRLKATVTFDGDEYLVAFGSNDRGESLIVKVKGDPATQPGGTGTGIRGGG
jgi:hypothetical protein